MVQTCRKRPRVCKFECPGNEAGEDDRITYRSWPILVRPEDEALHHWIARWIEATVLDGRGDECSTFDSFAFDGSVVR